MQDLLAVIEVVEPTLIRMMYELSVEDEMLVRPRASLRCVIYVPYRQRSLKKEKTYKFLGGAALLERFPTEQGRTCYVGGFA